MKIVHSEESRIMFKCMSDFARLLGRDAVQSLDRCMARLARLAGDTGIVYLYNDPYWPMSLDWTVTRENGDRVISGGMIFSRDYTAANAGTISNVSWQLHT